MEETNTRRLAEECIAAINHRAYDRIDALVTDDVQLRFPPTQLFKGSRGVRDFFEHLDQVLPSLTLAISKIHAGRDFAVVEWLSAGATSRGVEHDGMGATVLQVEDGRVSRIQLYLDTAEWQRLGG